MRYRLTPAEILECIDEGYILGFRTFILQGGEDAWFTDDILCNLLRAIKSRYPDCTVTLSLGERGHASYETLRLAGADRYLLRHETADQPHYQQLHPKEMSFAYRMECLQSLKQLGYQVGCGFMVHSPYQTALHIAKDLKFIETFQPDMCGIGLFIPHKDTPFGNQLAGTLEQTCSLKAEEFINDAEIQATLAYAEENKDNLALIDAILEKARPKKTETGYTCAGLTHREASVLLACENEEKIQEMYKIAEEIKLAFYGNRIVIFAPLYLSNYCVNSCVYCPYHAKNKEIARKKLTQEEIRTEVIALQVEYVLESIKTIYNVHHKNFGTIQI